MLLCCFFRIFLKCFHAQADLFLIHIQIYDLSGDLLSHAQYVRRLVYMSLGDLGYMEKCVHAKVGPYDDLEKPWQFSLTAAVGAQYNIGRHVGVYVEPGVSYYFDDGSSLQTIRKDKPCLFSLQAGFRLSY